MSYVADPRVDRYIEALPEWQRSVCQVVRGLVHDCDPQVTETINSRALREIFKHIISNNRHGGWRKLKNEYHE